MNDSLELREQLAQRSRQLQEIAAQLKTELFGIDTVIDRVIDSVRAWYVLPELVSRPVIVCLWGLTGTGKTQLVRRLAQLLGFYDRFIEVQMDGFSNVAGCAGRPEHRLPPALSLLGDIETSIAQAAYDAERSEASDARVAHPATAHGRTAKFQVPSDIRTSA